jgi:hypothetical protein
VHRVTIEGSSEGIPAHVSVKRGDGTRHSEQPLSSDGKMVLPLTDEEVSLDIVFPGGSVSDASFSPVLSANRSSHLSETSGRPV